MKNSIILVVVLVGIMILSTACGAEDPAPVVQAPAEDQPVVQAATTTPDTVVLPTDTPAAVVNGDVITMAAFEETLALEEARYAQDGVVPSDRAAFESTVITVMVDQLLIEQAALLQGLDVSDEELEVEIAYNIELAGSQEAFETWLAANMLTEAQFRESVRSAMLTGRIRDQVIASVPDTVEQVHARHILVSTEAEAQDVHQQLLNGADFVALAQAYSRDVSTKDLGGDLGWFASVQLTEPVVAEVAFALADGEFSEPVVSRLGYHIIQTLGRVDDRPLDDASKAVLYEMTFERWRQSLWDQANVVIYIGSEG